MSVKLVAGKKSFEMVGSGYLAPAQFEVSQRFESLRASIQRQADIDLKQHIDQMRADFSAQLNSFAQEDRARLETELKKIEAEFQMLANAMLIQFKQNLEQSISRLWQEQERGQVIARVLRHLVNDGQLDKNGSVAVPSQHFALTIDALDALQGHDADVVRRCLGSVDYLPANLIAVDSKNCSVLIDLDKITEDL
jgi:hypothetical protein